MITKHLWEYEHDYYSDDGNYFENGMFGEYESFDEFLDEWGTVDVDMNLIYRWDWKLYGYDDANSGVEIEGDYLHIYRILQRKGIYCGQIIKVTKDDEPRIKEYLSKYKPTIISFWEGI